MVNVVGRLDRRLDVVGVERVLAEQLLGLCHRLRALALLDEAHDLVAREHVAHLRAEAGLAVLAEVRNLRGAEKASRLQHVWSGRDGLHQHVHRKLVAASLKGLAAAVREILRLLCKVDRHHETSSLPSPGLSKTPPALYVSSMKCVAVERTPSIVERSAATNWATSCRLSPSMMTLRS